MKNGRLFLLTLLALVAFAANSVLCRLALKQTAIDLATFTLTRIGSAALLLWLIIATREARKRRRPLARLEEQPNFPARASRHGFPQAITSGEIGSSRPPSVVQQGSWPSAVALFFYAAGFSFAYTQLSAGTGALLLFGAVQATMILWGFIEGERLPALGMFGLMLALSGLVALTWPGVSTPPPLASASMVAAGIAWGAYSLRGRSVAHPLESTAANFLRALPLAVLLSTFLRSQLKLDREGIILAVISGAVTSGLGYVIWYAVVPDLGAIRAAIIQLCVPVLAAAAGIFFLNEILHLRLALAAAAILGGVSLVILKKTDRTRPEADR